MWRRTYLLLLAVRFYFAISPSYIHPDENFQGPEVIAGVFLNNPPTLSSVSGWEKLTSGSSSCISLNQGLGRGGVATRPNPRKETQRSHPSHQKLKKLTLYSSTTCRQYFFVSTPFDMGIHVRSTSAERVPAMACLRLPNGRPPLGMDGDGEGGNRAQSDLLRFTSPHDDSKCRARGLGNS